MYYVLSCEPILNEKGEALTETHNCFRIANIRLWKSGTPIKPEFAKDIPNPIEIKFDPLRGYTGSPREMKDLCIPIMSKRLSIALTEAGVDNIDYYPAVVSNTKTGTKYEYMAYKIIGIVSAADLSTSKYEAYKGVVRQDTSFHELSLDESKTHELKLFRLAEKASAILIHEDVKKHIEDSGINTLKFTKVEDWMKI